MLADVVRRSGSSDAIQPGVLYVGCIAYNTNPRQYKSTDLTSWSVVGGAGTSYQHSGYAYDKLRDRLGSGLSTQGSPQIGYRDGAQTLAWTRRQLSTATTTITLGSIFYIPEHDRWLIGGTNRQFWRIQGDIASGSITHVDVSGIVTNTDSTSDVYMSYNPYLKKTVMLVQWSNQPAVSSDGGITWTASAANSGLFPASAHVTRVLGYAPHGWMAGNGWMTSDGVNWTQGDTASRHTPVWIHHREEWATMRGTIMEFLSPQGAVTQTSTNSHPQGGFQQVTIVYNPYTQQIAGIREGRVSLFNETTNAFQPSFELSNGPSGATAFWLPDDGNII